MRGENDRAYWKSFCNEMGRRLFASAVSNPVGVQIGETPGEYIVSIAQCSLDIINPCQFSWYANPLLAG